jgi:hypothetical protein
VACNILVVQVFKTYSVAHARSPLLLLHGAISNLDLHAMRGLTSALQLQMFAAVLLVTGHSVSLHESRFGCRDLSWIHLQDLVLYRFTCSLQESLHTLLLAGLDNVICA